MGCYNGSNDNVCNETILTSKTDSLVGYQNASCLFPPFVFFFLVFKASLLRTENG